MGACGGLRAVETGERGIESREGVGKIGETDGKEDLRRRISECQPNHQDPVPIHPYLGPPRCC